MKKLNALLKKVDLFEKLAKYSDRKSFLEAIAQDQSTWGPEPFYPNLGGGSETGQAAPPPSPPEERYLDMDEYDKTHPKKSYAPTIPDNVVYNQLKGVNQQIKDIENRDFFSTMDPAQNQKDKEQLLVLQKRKQGLVAKLSDMMKKELASIDTQLKDIKMRSPQSATGFQDTADQAKIVALQKRKQELQEKLYTGKGLV
jgi:hypothetical protein